MWQLPLFSVLAAMHFICFNLVMKENLLFIDPPNTFCSFLFLRVQVPSGLPDLPYQGPGRRCGEGPRQRGRRPTEPGRLVLVGVSEPVCGGCYGTVVSPRWRHNTSMGWRQGDGKHQLGQHSSHSIAQNIGLLLNKYGTQLLTFFFLLLFLFNINKASAHLWNSCPVYHSGGHVTSKGDATSSATQDLWFAVLVQRAFRDLWPVCPRASWFKAHLTTETLLLYIYM